MKYFLVNLTAAFLLSAFLSACSSGVPRGYDPVKGILPIDELVADEKQVYWDNCYSVFVEAGVPENECQSNLFNIIDRRHGVSFNQIQLANVADEYFFQNIVNKKIHRLIRADSEVRDQVRLKFKSMDELMSYYQQQYSFHKGIKD
jgi:hypothetical protein